MAKQTPAIDETTILGVRFIRWGLGSLSLDCFWGMAPWDIIFAVQRAYS